MRRYSPIATRCCLLFAWLVLGCDAIDLGGNVATTRSSRSDAGVAAERDASRRVATELSHVAGELMSDAGEPRAPAQNVSPVRDAADATVPFTATPSTTTQPSPVSTPQSSTSAVPAVTTAGPPAETPTLPADPDSGLGSIPDASATTSDSDATTCDAQRFVEGSVRSARGIPVANVELTLTSASSPDTARATSDADGNYRIGPVCTGSYSLVPALDGMEFCAASADVELQSGNAHEDFTASESGCEPAAVVRSVQAYIFDPGIVSSDGGVARLSAVLGGQPPELELSHLARYLEMATNGHVHFEVNSVRVAEFPLSVDGTRFTQDTYFECEAGAACGGVPADDLTITQALNACEAIDTGDADEVWLVGAPNFGFYPRFELVPTCRRSADIVPMTYGLGLERLLGDFQWRSQNGLQTTFGTISPDVPVTPLDVFTHDAYDGRDGATAAGCGSSVFAPNATDFNVFDDPRTVSAYCDAFFDYPPTPDPLVATETLSCADWGCTELGFRRYWFAHLPRAAGRDAEGRLADFWRYITDPDDRNSTTGIICSSSLGSGWCDALVDGDFGTCNEGEWASTNRGPLWVDVYLGKEVSSVTLYDRACTEQVLSGHLEFSDGSDAVYFGALPDDGLTPLRIEFPTRVVRSLRIVIDQASGAYPGLGELLIE